MCGVYIYLLQKDTHTAAISFECLIFCEKLEDIKWYCNCPSAFLQQYMWTKHVSNVQFYVYATQQSFWQN